MELISKQVLELWNRYKPTIAVDAIEYDRELKELHGTNLAEVGTDCISRQAAISAICSACGKIDCDKMDKCEKLQLPPANCSEIPNSSDTISRQAAIEAVEFGITYAKAINKETGEVIALFEESNAELKEAVNRIKQLPPTQPEPSQVAKDIVRIVGNEQDMRVIQPEIIYCKDCKKQNRHYHESPYKDTVCPLTAWRGTAQGHEYDYQFCCFAERREVTT